MNPLYKALADLERGRTLQNPLSYVLPDEWRQPARELMLDIAPVTAQQRSISRISDMAEQMKQSSSPITKTLRGADIALEGAGLMADVVPGLKAAGIAASSLVPLMMRNTDSLPGIMRSQAGMIGGPKAKNADLDALARAQEMKAQGLDTDSIYADTGWFLDHPDGVPRFEIDDSKSYIKGSQGDTLGERFQHRELYPNYQGLDNIQYKMGGEFGSRGSYGLQDDTIRVAPGSPNERASTTLHEIQHAIQSRENMARGGSPEMFNQAEQAELVRDAINWNREIEAMRKTLPDGGKNADRWAIENKVIEWLQGNDAMDWLPSREARDLANQPYIAYPQHYPEDYQNAVDLMNMYGLDQQVSPKSSRDLYRALAGEADARLTQNRMNMSMDERLANPFYNNYDVPLEDQIVRMDSGTMMNLPMDEASRLKRARDMGFDTDTTWYHGTDKDFEQFDPSLSDSKRQTGTPTGAMVLTNDPQNAKTYAGRNNNLEWSEEYEEGGNIVPAYIDSGNQLDLEVQGDLTADRFFDWINTIDEQGIERSGHINELAKEAMQEGFDSMRVREVVDSAGSYYNPADTLFVFNPNQIRSKFAAFDPAKKDSANLLDSRLLPIPAGLLGLSLIEDEEI